MGVIITPTIKEFGHNFNTGEKDFSQMTVNDIINQQNLPPNDPDKLFSVGKYQITPSEMKDAVESLELKGNEKFTPELQNRIFNDYIVSKKQKDIGNFIKSGKGLKEAAQSAAERWPSIGSDPEEIKQSLSLAREKYQNAISSGKTPQEAMKIATLGTKETKETKETDETVKSVKPDNTLPQQIISPENTKLNNETNLQTNEPTLGDVTNKIADSKAVKFFGNVLSSAEEKMSRVTTLALRQDTANTILGEKERLSFARQGSIENQVGINPGRIDSQFNNKNQNINSNDIKNISPTNNDVNNLNSYLQETSEHVENMSHIEKVAQMQASASGNIPQPPVIIPQIQNSGNNQPHLLDSNDTPIEVRNNDSSIRELTKSFLSFSFG